MSDGVRRQIAKWHRCLQVEEGVRPVAIDHSQRFVNFEAPRLEHDARRLSFEALHRFGETGVTWNRIVDGM